MKYLINPDLVIRELDGELVILNPSDGFVHQINETGNIILRCVNDSLSEDFIVEALCPIDLSDDDNIKEVIRNDVNSFISDMISKNIIQEVQ